MEPEAEIIELALSAPRRRNGVMQTLKEIKGVRRLEISGAMLLKVLLEKVEQGEGINEIASKEVNIELAAHLAEGIYQLFDKN